MEKTDRSALFEKVEQRTAELAEATREARDMEAIVLWESFKLHLIWMDM